MINDAIKSIRSAQVLLIVILGFSLSFWAERSSQLKNIQDIERLLIIWDFNQKTVDGFSEDFRDSFDLSSGYQLNPKMKFMDFITLSSYLSPARTYEHYCYAGGSYYDASISNFSYFISLSKSTCDSLKLVKESYESTLVKKLINEKTPLLIESYEALDWDKYASLLNDELKEGCEEQEYSKDNALDILQALPGGGNKEEIFNLQSEALPYLLCAVSIGDYIFHSSVNVSSRGFSPSFDVEITNLQVPEMNYDGEAEPYGDYELHTTSYKNELIEKLIDVNSKLKYISNLDIEKSENWGNLFRALVKQYNYHQLTVPILDINVGYKNALILTCLLSIALLYWIHFLLGVINRSKGCKLETPWGINLLQITSKEIYGFNKLLLIIEGLPFIIFFFVSIISPLLPAIILLLFVNETEYYKLLFISIFIGSISLLILSSLYRQFKNIVYENATTKFLYKYF